MIDRSLESRAAMNQNVCDIRYNEFTTQAQRLMLMHDYDEVFDFMFYQITPMIRLTYILDSQITDVNKDIF